MKDENQKIKLNDKNHSEYQRIDENQIETLLGNDPEKMRTAKKGFTILRK